MVKRKGCRKVRLCACAGCSNGSIGWAPLPRVGDVNSGLQGRLADDGAKCGSQLSEEAFHMACY